MTKTPPPSTLLERLRDPGFTPRLREVNGLVDLLVDEDLRKIASRAIARVGAAALATLIQRFEASKPPLRAHVLSAIGRLVPEAAAVDLLLLALGDLDPKTRRNAAIALGQVSAETTPRSSGGLDVEDALITAWERDPRPPMRRTIAASLGKMGTVRALPLLIEASRSEDPELVRIAERARAMLERTASRGDGSRVDPSRSAARPVELIALSRRGLENMLADELSGIAAVVETRVEAPGRVRARLAGSIDALYAARTMLSFRFLLPRESRQGGEPISLTVGRAVTSEAARTIFKTWTVGTVRYRIGWAEGGHQRAATWETAKAIASSAPEYVNDPTSSNWEVSVARDDHGVEATVAPRALVDPRFAWRRSDVPASSHPTIAAALARVAGVREDDVVWDPFAGSGAELVERALLGPYSTLIGTDVEPRALAAARDNVDAAGLSVRLEQRDALDPAPPGVTLILTNPPMGRRAARIDGLGDMLDRFVFHAAAALAPRGRLVWLAPWPRRSRAAAAAAGLTLDGARMVDMGGFDAELQRWVKAPSLHHG